LTKSGAASELICANKAWTRSSPHQFVNLRVVGRLIALRRELMQMWSTYIEPKTATVTQLQKKTARK
jgi:hypothetical protein